MSFEPPPILEHLAVARARWSRWARRRSRLPGPLGPGGAARASRTSGSSWSCSSWAGTTGLNTVVPHGIDGYNRGRRALAASRRRRSTRSPPEIGLHPSMGGDGQAAREAGGWRSCRASAIPIPTARTSARWRSGRRPAWRTTPRRSRPAGWAVRSIPTGRKPGDDPPGLHVGGRSLPLALRARKTEVPSVESLESYKLQLAGTEPEKQAERTGAQSDRGRRSPRATTRFWASSAGPRCRPTSRAAGWNSSPRKSRAGPKYPNFGLARRLELIAQIIKADFGTRIFYTSLDGFDTHANQLGTHAALLNELSDSIAAFHDDLAAAGQADRVAMLDVQRIRPPGPGERLAGDRPRRGRAGLRRRAGRQARTVGSHPSLDDLDDGDLKYHTDFRPVYASLLADWLGLAADPVVGSGFKAMPLFRRA